MKVTAIPLDIVWSDKSENMFAVANGLSKIDKDVDIVVLPELFSTGFIPDRQIMSSAAETNNGPTMEALRCWATLYNVAICGSFLARDGSQFYNRAFFIEPSGDVTFYDKAHLFGMSNESSLLSVGHLPIPVVRYRGWNISFIVCYDLRFPAWCRNMDCKYDLMLIPANWPTTRQYAWSHLLIARAIENQAYYVGCNRTGSDDYGEYSNEMTFAVDYVGKDISKRENGMVTVMLDKDKMESYREKFPVWRDNDHFSL